MHFSGTKKLNDIGHLTIGGCDTVELAKEFGTPLYVFDEEGIRSNCRRLSETLKKQPVEGQIIYAGKAFLTLAMCRIIQEEGLGLDVVSGGELYTALTAGFPMEKIYFHGNNKTPEELEMALSAGIGRYVVDNCYELDLLNKLASKMNKQASILLRLTPGVSAHTHHYIQTGHEDSKFGFNLSNGQALEATKKALSYPGIKLLGYHCHIGSQIFCEDSFALAVRIMVDYIKQVSAETGWTAEELNLGGGLGIRYTEEDTPISFERYVELITENVISQCRRTGLKLPRIVMEPGRSIIGEMGTTLYTVGSIKQVSGGKTYLAVNGGMSDNPRTALYQAQYEAVLANKVMAEPENTYAVVGKCCESGDILIHEIALPKAKKGDILAVFCTGAYNYSMASNYNRIPRPAAILVNKGEAVLIIRRESFEDLLRNDIIPEHLK